MDSPDSAISMPNKHLHAGERNFLNGQSSHSAAAVSTAPTDLQFIKQIVPQSRVKMTDNQEIMTKCNYPKIRFISSC